MLKQGACPWPKNIIEKTPYELAKDQRKENCAEFLGMWWLYKYIGCMFFSSSKWPCRDPKCKIFYKKTVCMLPCWRCLKVFVTFVLILMT